MLDGILGRGFSVKCKSLIKATGARIAVVRRRAEAKQRFLNEDLAKLLSNGLDINAYGRTEEFLAGMNLLTCYDFVVQSCEYILKQLSRMQKHGECPEECREVVASLMYAAARFSDLPELRDLRDIFQQKYGSCLEPFVNQKFVEKLSSRPPPKEKRLQVLQDIASEFSIKWDSKGFEQRMAAPSVVSQVDEQKGDIVKQRAGLVEEKSRIKSCGEGKVWRRDEGGHQISKRKEISEYRENSVLRNGGSSSQGDDDNLNSGRHRLTENKPSYPTEKCDADSKAKRSNNSSHEKKLDNNAHDRCSRTGNGIRNTKGESIEALFHEKTKFAPSHAEQLGKTENAFSSYKHSNSDSALGSMRKGVDDGSNRLKPCSSYAFPPPYIKSKHNATCPPYVKPKEDKQKVSGGSKDFVSNLDEHLIDAGSCNRSSNVVNLSGTPHTESADYQDETIPLPKPRSIRRKHHKSSSGYNVVDTPEDVKAVNRSSSSRRKDHSKKGLQILFDEEHHRKDEEERMIDKLLIHYSKKPAGYDAGKLKKKLLVQPLHQIIRDGESSSDQSINVHAGKSDAFPPPRSVSLPHEQAEPSPELKKVFARSNTFQPDHQAAHVHPKLPDYDELAARFAALKGR
ncbi:Regulator of Vps4 activity in the MVB pathway protein [Perilla frutescens var. hirtella]|nr:Regulator of Vps4 activity in the MVB pathway protein [Perilla frutescens var. hirtella]